MEEDLKYIELFIDFCRAPYNFEHESDAKSYKELSNKIEHLIKAYKELEEKLDETLNANLALVQGNANSIPVSLVEETLEKILNNNEYKVIFEGDAEFPDEATIINAKKYIKIEVLQKLLEKRK